MAFNFDDYIEVKDRIISFYKDHPDGRVQTEVIELTDARVTVKARVYQYEEDSCPTTGHSWLNIPGSTNFTKGSELENAETSAVGRALAMMGYEVKKSIASRDEVAMKQDDEAPADQGAPPVPGSNGKKATDKQVNLIMSRLRASTAETEDLLGFISGEFNITSSDQLLMDHIDPLLAWIATYPSK